MRLSHAVFAVMLIGLGIIGLATGHFTPTWSGVPQNFPARAALAYLCASVSLLTGFGLLWQRSRIAAARALLIYLVAWAILFRVSYLVVHPTSSGYWWGCGESAVMVAVAWILFTTKGLRIAGMLYGFGLVPFGVAHFTFLDRTVTLVPGWLPWHLAWAYATGCAFIVAGLAVLLGVYARLAATLSLAQVALFTLLVWIPIILASPSASDWNELIQSCALTAAAWVVADSYRGTPWLSVASWKT